MPGMTKKGFILCIIVILPSLGWRPLGASVSVDELSKAIAISQQALIAQQQKEGHWFSYVETNTLYNSLQVLLYYYLQREEEERETIDELCRYLVNTQSDDGSWPFYEGGSGDPGLTTLNYFALKLSGYQKQDPTLLRARDYIILHGGAESIYGMYKLILALFDQYYFSLPDIPILPLIVIAPRLSWLRMMVIPLMVVLEKQAYFFPPQETYITELFISGNAGKIIPPNGELMSVMNRLLQGSQKEYGVDSALLDRSGSLTDRIYLTWLLAKQNTSDGLFYDYQPNTFFPLLSLKALEDTANHGEEIDRALRGLSFFQHQLPTGIYQPPADATIPATFSVLMALSETNMSLENSVIRRGVDFLWSRQNKMYGDWLYQMAVPVIPGGWGFSFHSESFPDTDDTATTLMVLRTIYDDSWRERWWDFTRGVEWLLAMQNRNGGWGTWDREAPFFTPLMKEVLTEVVLNESVVDHTTRVLMTLSLFDYTEAGSFRVARAVRWLKDQQLEDGSWRGTWFVNYIYQTANVLGALSQVKAAMGDSYIQRSLNYIFAKQREDGGWGESPSSFSTGHYVPLGYSSPSQTALILFGMLQFLRGNQYQYIDQIREPINRAIHFILSTQGEDGLWHDPTYVGTVFPQIQYVRYPLFQEASILGVLGMYNQDRDHF
jgi:squalene-hopene/tetraprenyl-beta-curcumene cyclase